MKNIKLFVGCCFAVAAGTVLAQGAAPQLKNGNFDPSQGGWPLGAGVTIERDADAKRGDVLVLKCTPGKSVKSVQEMAVDPSWSILKFSYWVNIPALKPGKEGYHDARMTVTAMGDNNKVWHLVAGNWKAPTKGWTKYEQNLGIPEGVKKINIAPAIFESEGEMRISDLKVELVVRRGEMVDAAVNPRQPPQWGEEPVEVSSAKRGTVCLNGVWKFMPAVGPAAEKPLSGGWGWQRVPGGWEPRAVGEGLGEAWVDFSRETPAGWYARELSIPAQWNGRAILLDLKRVSTDAIVFVDGKEAGRVAWPRGEVDITKFVAAGKKHNLMIKVIAVASDQELTRFMGMAPGQSYTEKPRLGARGLIGDVLLTSRPSGAHLTDVFVKPSVRKGELGVEVSYAGLAKAERVALSAVVRDAKGAVAKSFTHSADAKAGEGVLHAAWAWKDAVLWDTDNPHLYTIELSAKSAGIDDVMVDTFGFREFHIEGRICYLNGKTINLRAVPIYNPTLTREAIRGAFEGMRRNGFNCWELQPDSRDERGRIADDGLIYSVADSMGILVIGVVNEMSNLVGKWNQAGVADDWEKRMRDDIRQHRNHPSLIMWDSSPNRFGHGQDQNPAVMGRQSDPDDAKYRKDAALGRDALARVRKFDPTRPVYSHAGAAVGDIYTSNCYLNLFQLQEREEWPSAWAKDGDMPMFMVEFGTPLYSTFHRNKMGYGNAGISEPLYTEYAAIYFGADAYKMETPEYRARLAGSYQSGRNWVSWHGPAANEILTEIPSFVAINELFNRNTYRSWRTFGVTGVVPWSLGAGWFRRNPDEGKQPRIDTPFQPGRLGFWRDTLHDTYARYLSDTARTKAGDAIVANNSETLAWIAGATDDKNDTAAFTDKTHNYRLADTVKKQIALINDTRQTAQFAFRWTATLAGKEIANGNANGNLEAGGILLRPIEFKLPATAADRSDGVIKLEAKIGKFTHTDTFAFRAFANEKPAALPAIALLDPAGETTAMLKKLGIQTTTWSPNQKATPLLIGRRALEKTPPDKLAEIEKFARDGGRVLLMAQDPEWMRKHLGFRVARHLSRRVFTVGDSPLFGLDNTDLSDWAGFSRLVPENDLAKSDGWQAPLYGWRWGARHAVASAAVEVPHNAGWTPLLRCEFDGAYTPLAKINIGAGTVMFCALDLEDHAAADPVAERITRNLLDLMNKAPSAPRVATTYIGDNAGATFVKNLGLEHAVSKTLPQNGLVILGNGAEISDADLNAFMTRGGKILVLARRGEKGALGVTYKKADKFSGSINLPNWTETLGIWSGETRIRADYPAWIINGGASEIAADGLFAKKGGAFFCQLDPDSLDDKKFEWLRYTKWRQTRAIAQIAANLGASFAFDSMILRPDNPERISLAGFDIWKAAVADPLPLTPNGTPVSERPQDKGIGAKAAEMVKPNYNDSAWKTVTVPALYDNYGAEWEVHGEVVFRYAIDIPEAWAGRDLRVSLSLVSDFDDTYFDGVRIGGITGNPNAWNTPRVYTVPASQVKPGKRVLAVRVWNQYMSGGLTGNAGAMFIEPVKSSGAPRPPAYQPGWNNDAAWGDDPYRYYRW
ncbi:MAG: beta-galactosidase [Kiritimatiellaeota bacterium]|nr:beta-galactosidase [Kiritimatiellota bacterium]